jgi:hypothetical protein
MNFKFMPELAWQWGYPFGLTLIALSASARMVQMAWVDLASYAGQFRAGLSIADADATSTENLFSD